MSRETESYGALTLVRERPAPTLATHAPTIEKLLRKPLPADVAAFYATSDGMTYAASRAGVSLGIDDVLCGLEAMFAGFKKHKQLKNEEAFDDFQSDMYDAPFCGTIWSEDFGIEEKGDLARLNTMLRSKLLVSVAGQPDALVIDLAPKAKKGVTKDYEILLVHEGNDVVPLDLDFSTFVKHFALFGATGWFWAFVGKKGGETLNIDPAESVESGMASFAPDFGKEIEALVARARR